MIELLVDKFWRWILVVMSLQRHNRIIVD